METRAGARVSLEKRVTALETRVDNMEGKLTHIEANTSQMLDIMTASKTIWGFVRKHSGTLIGFAIGAGLLNQEIGDLLKALFT